MAALGLSLPARRLAVPATVLLLSLAVLTAGVAMNRHRFGPTDGAAGHYCDTVVDPTAADAEAELGMPSGQRLTTVDGARALVLTYGSFQLAYRWSGDLATSTYLSGC